MNMNDASPVHVIISHSGNRARLLSCLSALAKAGDFKSLTIVGRPGCQPFELNGRKLQELPRPHMRSCAPDENIYGAINKTVAGDEQCEQFFILADHVAPGEGCLGRLLSTQAGLADCGCLNPIFMDAATGLVSHLGTTADFLGNIHYLYEGIDPGSALALKRRAFQLGNENAFLVSKSNFASVNGFNCALEDLAFVDFCLRLSARGKVVYTEPSATAITSDIFDSMRHCGLWNSMRMAGKLAPDLLKPDYARHVLADGLPYGASSWLVEKPLGLPANGNARQNWLADPNPFTLLPFLASLEKEQLWTAIDILRTFSALLPRSFEYYRQSAQKLQGICQQENLPDLQKAVADWEKSASRFRYGSLRKGIKALEVAGIYDCSLDRCPAVFNAWLETGSKAGHMEIGKSWPAIAVLMPVWNPEPEFFKQAVDSIKKQTYDNWQLCIADDASTEPGVSELLRGLAEDDPRIRVMRRERNGRISRATNSALSMADAPWVALLDQDDLLADDALAKVAAFASRNDRLGMIYSDEDHVDEFNIRRTPFFKADPDYVHYTGHLSSYRTDILRNAGGFRPDFDGSQDYDASLRIFEILGSEGVGHIAEILYHWRVHSKSTSAALAAKPYVLEATQKAMEEAALRQGHKARACPAGRNNFYRLCHDIAEKLPCSLVLLDSGNDPDPKFLECLTRLAAFLDMEVLWQPLRQNLSPPSVLRPFSPRALPFAGREIWDWGEKAAAAANKSLLLFLDVSLVPLEDCRPEQLLFLAQGRDVAMVGGLIWRGDQLWHGGLYPDISGLPFPLLRGTPGALLPAYCWGQLLLDRKVIGISWQCMAMRRERFFSGLRPDENMGALAMADMSLAMEAWGLFTLASPWGQWRQQSAEKEARRADENFLKKWGECVKCHGLRNACLRAAPDMDWTLILQD